MNYGGAGGMSRAGCTAPSLGINTGSLWEFISKTQMKRWNKLLELHGGDQDIAMRKFALRVASEIDSRGVLDVLRQGVKDRGVQIDLAYFRPGLTIAEGALDEYNANVLSYSRQLHFSFRDTNQSVDVALFVNGLPVAAVELKNPNTGQNADHAIAQYRKRDPNDLFFAKRALVHFAVDPDRAFIATRLRGQDTEFLPFNVGSNGPGMAGGAGNPRPSGMLIIRFPISGNRSGSGTTGWRYFSGSCMSRGGQENREGQSAYLATDLPSIPSVARRAADDRARSRARGRARITSSSIQPGRGSRTRSRGFRTGCRTCSATTTSPSSIRSLSSPTGSCWTGSFSGPSTSSTTRPAW